MTLPTAGDVLRPAYITNAILAFVGDPALGEEVGYSAETSDSSTFTTTETVIGSVTFPEVIGAVYHLICPVHLVSTGTDVYQATMRETDLAGAEVAAGRVDSRTSDQTRPNIILLFYRYTATATGSKTFVVTGDRISGTGNVRREADTTHPQQFTAKLRLNP